MKALCRRPCCARWSSACSRRRAEADDPFDDAERYGWWGDTYPAQANDRIGSGLWLLRRVRLTAQTQRDAEFYAREALDWLIEDGRVTHINILTEQVQSNRLNTGVNWSSRTVSSCVSTLLNSGR